MTTESTSLKLSKLQPLMKTIRHCHGYSCASSFPYVSMSASVCLSVSMVWVWCSFPDSPFSWLCVDCTHLSWIKVINLQHIYSGSSPTYHQIIISATEGANAPLCHSNYFQVLNSSLTAISLFSAPGPVPAYLLAHSTAYYHLPPSASPHHSPSFITTLQPSASVSSLPVLSTPIPRYPDNKSFSFISIQVCLCVWVHITNHNRYILKLQKKLASGSWVKIILSLNPDVTSGPPLFHKQFFIQHFWMKRDEYLLQTFVLEVKTLQS